MTLPVNMILSNQEELILSKVFHTVSLLVEGLQNLGVLSEAGMIVEVRR
jgi:hypothetical protein